MNKQKIRSYSELADEKKRLESLLVIQKQQVKVQFTQLKEELKPVRMALSFLGKFFTRDSSNHLVNFATGAFSKLVVKNILLSKSGWLTRFIVPFLFRNYASHALKDEGDRLVHAVGRWLKSRKATVEARPY